MTISINTKTGTLHCDLLEGPDDQTFVIPPRCEVVRKFDIKYSKPTDIRYVPTQEITTGVFAANTLIQANHAFVRIINTTEVNKTINKNNLMTNDIKNYDMCTFDEVNVERSKRVVDVLAKDIPEFVKTDFTHLCAQYTDIFALETDTMTVNNFYEQRLRVTDNEPVYSKNYRLPHSQQAEIDSQVDTFLKNNLIEPSTSNYNSPVLIVPKKQKGKWRMCIDYRLINKKVKADRFPLPRIDEILDGLGRAKFFSILDLFQGFHQVPLHESSRDITSFSTNKGSFRWRVVPFGLNVAPNSFSRMMSIAFSGLSPMQCFLYMDDLIVIGASEQHHLANLQSVFDACRKSNLKLNPYKCQFFRKEVTYLGHLCTPNGVTPDMSKIDKVKNYPIPQNKDDVKRFVAFANYYRKFIKHFASKAFHLNKITKKKSIFVWTPNCQKAFDALKTSLTTLPILQYPDFTKQFILTVDACKYGTGAILSQMHGENDLPVAYASKSFTPGEFNKPTIEQELIAIDFAIRHFRPYIYGTKFLVKTDHRPLVYLYNLKDPSSKLTRIRLELEEYDFVVQHIKGKDNVGADALSRMHISEFKRLQNPEQILAITRAMSKKLKSANENEPMPDEQNEIIDINVYENLATLNYKKLPRLTLCRDLYEDHFNLLIIQNRKTLMKINLSKQSVKDRSSLAVVLSMLQAEANRLGLYKVYTRLDDFLFHETSIEEFKEMGNNHLSALKIIIVPPRMKVDNVNEQLNIIRRYHDDPIEGGHAGTKRLFAKISAKYFWKNMMKTISSYVRTCHACQVNKTRVHTREHMTLTKTPQTPFDIVSIDTIGPLAQSENNNRYAVTIICHLSKYLITAAVPNKDSQTIAKAIFHKFILIYGPMNEILTDRGTEYKNQTLSELCKLLNISLVHSTAHHHETLGNIERNHRTLNEYLRSYLQGIHSKWEEFLPFFTYCYNTTPNTSFNCKFTPYDLVFGKNPKKLHTLSNQIIDPIYNFDNYVLELKYKLQLAHKTANMLLNIAKEKSKYLYDAKTNLINLKTNDQVLITNEDGHKLDSVYLGPFKVISLKNKNVAVLDEANNKIIEVHINRIKKYMPNET